MTTAAPLTPQEAQRVEAATVVATSTTTASAMPPRVPVAATATVTATVSATAARTTAGGAAVAVATASTAAQRHSRNALRWPERFTRAEVDAQGARLVAAASKGDAADTRMCIEAAAAAGGMRFELALCQWRHPTNQYNALFVAARGGHAECISMLLEAVPVGARGDVEERMEYTCARHGSQNATAMQAAVGFFVDAAQALAQPPPGAASDKSAAEVNAGGSTATPRRDTPRVAVAKREACTRASMTITELLACPTAGAQLLTVDDRGLFPLMVAVGGRNARLVTLLMRSMRREPRLLMRMMQCKDRRLSFTPIMLAADMGAAPVLRELLSTAVSLDHSGACEAGALGGLLRTTDHAGRTALHRACRRGSLECVELLLRASQSERRGPTGPSPPSVRTTSTGAGAGIGGGVAAGDELRDRSGRRIRAVAARPSAGSAPAKPLTAAASTQSLVTMRDRDGKTPLALACMFSSKADLSIVSLMLRVCPVECHEALTMTYTTGGMDTPLTFARLSRRWELLELLHEHASGRYVIPLMVALWGNKRLRDLVASHYAPARVAVRIQQDEAARARGEPAPGDGGGETGLERLEMWHSLPRGVIANVIELVADADTPAVRQ